MRKELIWAGVIGIVFGLVIGFGAWRVRSSVAPKNTPNPTATPQPKVGQFKIAINKPNNLDVITQNPTNISGITKASSWVVVSTEEEDFLTQSINDGTFSLDVDLPAGLNHIKVTSINADGNTASQNILTVYSESFETNSEATQTSTDAGKINTSTPPKAYLGTVTDITDSTIQIKSTDSQIQQIATNKLDVTVINTTGTTNKTVKITDIAIGDFIIAMGHVNGKEVLDTQRILITDSTAEPKISLSLVKVSEITKNSLKAVSLSDSKEVTVTPDKNTTLTSYLENKVKTIKLADIEVDDLLIIVTDSSSTSPVTRSVFDIGTR